MGLSSSVRSLSSASAALSYRIAGLFDEFVHGGHLTALGAPMKILFVTMLLDMQVFLPLLPIAYLATLIVYSVDYYGSMEKDGMTNPGRAAYLSNNMAFSRYRIGAYAVALFLLLVTYANVRLILVIMALLLAGALYTVTFKGVTKRIPGFKNLYTSSVWTAGIFFGLLAYYPHPMDMAVVLMFAFLLMRSLGNVIFCDIKDARSDAAEGLKTVPVLLGRERTLSLLMAMNGASFLPLIAGVWLGVLPTYCLAVGLVALFTCYYLTLEKSGRAGQIGHTLADAETLMLPLIAFIARHVQAL